MVTPELRIRLDKQPVSQALIRLQAALPIGGDMSPAMRGLAQILKSGAQLRFRAGRGPDGIAWRPTRRGGQTLRDTGRLRNSITSAFSDSTATVGTNVIYAAIHQFGGVIRARNGPFLAIPVSEAARAHGSAGGGPTGMAGLAVWQTLKGQFVLGSADGTVHYLLRRQVVMPARPFLGVSDADGKQMLALVSRYLEQAWKR